MTGTSDVFNSKKNISGAPEILFLEEPKRAACTTKKGTSEFTRKAIHEENALANRNIFNFFDVFNVLSNKGGSGVLLVMKPPVICR